MLGLFVFLLREDEINMLGTLICTDTSKLESYKFYCVTRPDGSRLYRWSANNLHNKYNIFSDIYVFEYPDKKTGWFRIDKLNKTSVLPKIVQLANAGILKNYEL